MKRLLLHICCGPCTPYVYSLLEKRFAITGFFFNPNIHPEEENVLRRDELARVARQMNWSIVVPPHDAKPWRHAVRNLEFEPERGRRCSVCFHFRLREAFTYARRNGYEVVATTLSVSPHKKTEQINSEGKKLEAEFAIEFLAENFKKKGGFEVNRSMAAELQIHHQNYCGCEFSLEEMRKRAPEGRSRGR